MDYRCNDGRFLVSASCVLITNPAIPFPAVKRRLIYSCIEKQLFILENMQKSHNFTDARISYKNFSLPSFDYVSEDGQSSLPSCFATISTFIPTSSAVHFTLRAVKCVRLVVLYSGVTCCEPFELSDQ